MDSTVITVAIFICLVIIAAGARKAAEIINEIKNKQD